MEIKKVSIVGCGALGIMYGSHIQKSFPEASLQFIVGNDRMERYRNTKFYANGEEQAFDFAGPDGSGGCSDLVIFTVKYNDLDAAVSEAKNHIGENTLILSFLNGISSEEIIGRTYDTSKIIHSMVAGMDATKTGYSVRFSGLGYVAFGSMTNNLEAEKSLAEFLDKAKIRYEIHKDIMKTIWWKYILNIGINQTSAILRSTYELFQTSAYAEKLMRMAMAEAYEVARKVGINLNEDDIEDCVKIMKTLSPEGKTSMCQDIEAGRATEVDMFAGTLIELGKKYGVHVPINTFLYNAFKALESRG